MAVQNPERYGATSAGAQRKPPSAAKLLAKAQADYSRAEHERSALARFVRDSVALLSDVPLWQARQGDAGEVVWIGFAANRKAAERTACNEGLAQFGACSYSRYLPKPIHEPSKEDRDICAASLPLHEAKS